MEMLSKSGPRRSRPIPVALIMLVIVALFAATLAPPAEGQEDPPVAPNFLFIVADDLDALISPYWDAMPQTAALIRDQGFTFRQTFANTPTCCPARANLLTGKYAHNTNVWANFGPNGGLSNFQAGGHEAATLAVVLDQAGYQTSMIGKYMNEYAEQPNHIPAGWDDWFVFSDNRFYYGYNYLVNNNGVTESYGSAPEDYATDVVNNRLVSFLQSTETNDDDPFFAMVMPTAPHLPLPPAPRHANHQWASATRPSNPNFYEADMSDKPFWLQTAVPGRAVFRDFITTTNYQDRMGSLLALDDLVADAVAALDAQGELDNTYLVFTSDNGYNMGAHGLNSKIVPYEESVRIPLVIAGPGIAPGSSPALTGLIDLMPTVLDLAGVAIPGDVDGRSLQPIWSSTATNWRTEILIEYRPTFRDTTPLEEVWLWAMLLDAPGYRAVRTYQYTYIEWWDGEVPGAPNFHEYELYDLTIDPRQVDNLLAEPNAQTTYAAVLADLEARLDLLVSCSGPSC